MKVPDKQATAKVCVIVTKMSLYHCCYFDGMVAVRYLGDPTGLEGSWGDRPSITGEWRETATLMVGEWERHVWVVERYKSKNRNSVWVEALKRGTMVADYFLNGLWYATVFGAKEIC